MPSGEECNGNQVVTAETHTSGMEAVLCFPSSDLMTALMVGTLAALFSRQGHQGPERFTEAGGQVPHCAAP